MSDIRKACKIFLDFVYENNIIPEEIVKKLKESAFWGDIRKICSILQYNSSYKKKDNDNLSIENDVHLFNSLDKQRLQWLKSPFIWDELNHLKSICNAFFHNVYVRDFDYALFSSTCSALIDHADFIDKSKKDSYINQINEALNLNTFSQTKTVLNEYNISANQHPSSEEKIGALVRTAFRNILQNGKLSQNEIDQLQTMDFCKQIFRTHGNQYPILTTVPIQKNRYYVESVTIGNKTYYISSQWFNDQIMYLKKWLKNHGANI